MEENEREKMDQFQNDLFQLPANEFAQHLSLNGNNRIIFSGKFGMGKTYFLNEFFTNDRQDVLFKKKKYEPFHIYPVNYSIAANEDIYEYVKYDILHVMLEKQIPIKHDGYKAIDALPFFAKEHPLILSKIIASRLLSVGANDTTIQLLKNLFTEGNKTWKEIKKKIEKEVPDSMISHADSAVDFLSEVETKSGSIYALDLITKIIKDTIPNYTKKNETNSVLILDDLDRVDPAHIFRLLNVFSAHLDQKATVDNKLGFDKIVFVCDIQNVREIFRSLYGGSTDFNGYIDKFYSREIFYFQNKKGINLIAEKCFTNVTISDEHRRDMMEVKNVISRYAFLGYKLFQVFAKYGLINLRKLITKFKYPTQIPNRGYVVVYERAVNIYDPPFLIQFYLLNQLVGGIDALKELVKRLPPKAFTEACTTKDANMMLYYTNEESFLNKRSVVTINGEKFTFERSINGTGSINEAIIWQGSQPDQTEYTYTAKDYKFLLEHFIDTFENLEFSFT